MAAGAIQARGPSPRPKSQSYFLQPPHPATQHLSTIVMTFQSDLAEHGYTIVPSVLTIDEIAECKNELRVYEHLMPAQPTASHGVHQFAEAGHQKFSWFIRTNPNVQKPFKKLLNTDDLIVSFDGFNHIHKADKRRDTSWTHTDQSPAKGTLSCYQGFVSLTDNSERTFVCYDGSHLQHADYFASRCFNTATKNFKRDWHKIDSTYLQANQHRRKALSVKAGDLVIWDSRTFHQNQYGKANSEERFVQYISFQPRNCPANTRSNQAKRLKYFGSRRTTSHWSAPVKVNGLQPQIYGDKSKLIDYTKVPSQSLEEFDCLSLV